MATAAKKASPRKPARVPREKPAPKTPDAPEGAVPAAPAAPPKTLKVLGRDILVKMPTAEQLMALEETISAVVASQKRAEEYETTKAIINRYYRITTGLFVDDADKQWVADGREDGTITLFEPDVLNIATNVIKLFEGDFPGAPQNRADKRAAARKKA